MTKLKNKIWIALLGFVMAVAVVCGVGLNTKTTHAATSTSAKYKTYGTYSTGGGYSSGCPSYFGIYMHSSSQNGSTGTIYDGEVLNWTYVYIKIEVSDMKSHSSFKLTKDGSTYSNKSLSGTSNQTLYSGSLPDGEYELTYVGTYKKNIFTSTVTYTYKYNFVIDKSAPVQTLKKGTTSISSGSYANQQITYSVSDYDPYIIYYKKPGYSSYYTTTATSYSVAATSANNGWWYFYSMDDVGNVSSTMRVYLDTVAPVGKVTNSAGSTIANGGYTNKSIKYTATDTGGISYYQVKKPGTTTWTTYTAGTELSGTYGWYTFRAVDKAGNISEEYQVYYDASTPTASLYGGTTSYASGSFVNAPYIKYVASDSGSNVSACYVRMPGASYYTTYASGTQLATEGKYYFYSVDKSGNVSATVNITLDKTKPIGTIYGGSAVITNGSATNAESIRFVPYDQFGLASVYVKRPNASGYVSYTSGTSYTTEGEYSFYAVDRAGNRSDTYTVTLNRQIPAAQLYVDDVKIDNNSYTNGWHIRFECAETCYVKLPNSEEFVPYMSGAEYYRLGKYVFYGVDDAGNSTGYYTIVIDKTQKPLEVQNVTDGETNGDVVLTWTDGDPNVYAPIKTVTINGKPYTKGTPIYTIDTGVYKVVATDRAGNVWETEFKSTKVNVLTQTLQQKYYEVYDENGDYYAFTSYESAYAFAVARENGLVRTGDWHNEDWDTGIAMDAIDAVNAKNGTYFIYKKEGNAEAEVAYFTQERLNAVIAQYAKQGINSYFYWEKEPAAQISGENLYEYSDSKTILAKSIDFCENVGCRIDGEVYVGTSYAVEGRHSLVAFDEWGNTCDYTLIVVGSPTEIYYSVGEGSANLVVFDRTYYFKKGIEVSISDDLDSFAMFVVYDQDDNVLGKFLATETYAIEESGRYRVVAINHYGESEEFQLVISLDAPSATLTDNEVDKKLEIKIDGSIDADSHIQTLEIYKSHDNGTTWTLVALDDYGKPVALESMEYAFRTTALYKVVLTDEFRTGIDSIISTFDYVQPEPYGELVGVENGGYTNGTASFTWTDEAKVSLERGGGLLRETLMYKSGEEISVDGIYVLTFENYDGYKMIYTFTIDTVAPVVEMEGATVGAATNNNVSLAISEEGLITELFKDGVSLGAYVPGTVITESGSYVLVVKDLADNKVEIAFVIDKEVDYTINVNDKGLANSVTITAGEEVTYSLTSDGVAVDYELGNILNVAGKYNLVITDNIGNTSEMSFEVVKSLLPKFEHNFDDMEGFEEVLVNGEFKRLNYGTLELFEDGVYEVGVVANGQTYTFNLTIDGTKPTLKLNGVENGKTTETGVTLSDVSEEATVEVFLNNERMLHTVGEELTQEGSYRVVVTDTCGNSTEYTFKIQGSQKPVYIAFAIIGVLAVAGIAVFVILKKRKKI